MFISLVGLIITPLLVANFGIEQYGIYILVTSIFGYYGIFDLGMGQGLIKFVAEYNSTDATHELNDAVNSIFTFQLMMGFVLSGSIVIFSKNIVHLLNVSAVFYDESVTALKIATIGFFFSMLAATYSSAIKGLERFGGVTVVDSISNLFLNVFLLIIVMQHFGIKEAVWANVLIATVQLIAYAMLFKRHKNSYRFGLKFNVPIIKKFLSFTLYLFLSKISGILSKYGVRFIISFFLGPSAVTLFVIPSKLLGAIGGVLSSAAGALFPYTSRLAVLGKKNEIKRSFVKSNIIFASISIPISIFVIIYSKPIMTLWMGAEFAADSWLILSILTLSSLIGSFTAIPLHVILGLGKSKLVLLFSTFIVTSYLIFLPLLTKTLGVHGAAIAMLLTASLNIGLVMIKTTRAIGVGLLDFFNNVYRIHILPILSLMISVVLYHVFFNQGYMAELLFGTVIVGCYYIFLLKKKALIF